MSQIRAVSNLILLIIVGVLALAGMLIAVGFLGPLLWPLAFIMLFLIAVYFAPGGFSGLTIIVGILVMAGVGLGLHAVLGSVIGYDPAQMSYMSTMSAIQLSTVGSSVSDGTWNVLFGIVAL